MDSRLAPRVPDELSLISKQLAIIQEYISLKFGTEFEDFYKSRSNQTITIPHQSQYDFGVTIKDEPTNYHHQAQSNQNQQQTTAVNNNQQDFYYAFQNASGTPAFTFTSQNIPTTAPSQSPQSGTSRTPTSKNKSPAHKTKAKPAGETSHSCPRQGCNKTFKRLQLLKNHERLDHQVDLTCNTQGCNRTFPDKQQITQHEQRCPLKPHKCSWEGCDKTFRTSKLLHGHISAVHRKMNRATFKCSVPGCTQGYPDTTKLKLHENRCRFAREYNDEYNAIPVDDGAIDITASALALAQATSLVSGIPTTSVFTVGDETGGNFDSRISRLSMSSGVGMHPITVDMGTYFIKTEVAEEEIVRTTQT